MDPGSRVVLLQWPSEARSIEAARSLGTPRLLLIAPGEPPPPAEDCVEDWIRLPADDGDLRARTDALAVRAARHQRAPVVRGDGRIDFRGEWGPLSARLETIAQVLVDRFGEVVGVETLRTATGDGEVPMTHGALRIHVMRLRKRIRPLGLALRSVHGRGYVLEVAPTPADLPSPH